MISGYIKSLVIIFYLTLFLGLQELMSFVQSFLLILTQKTFEIQYVQCPELGAVRNIVLENVGSNILKFHKGINMYSNNDGPR